MITKQRYERHNTSEHRELGKQLGRIAISHCQCLEKLPGGKDSRLEI